MKLWTTYIYAICNTTGEMAKFGGENIPAPTKELAQEWCNIHCGYLHVDDELVAEIPCRQGTYEPDFSKMIDYENIQNN